MYNDQDFFPAFRFSEEEKRRSEEIIRQNLEGLAKRQGYIEALLELEAEELISLYLGDSEPDSYLAYEILSSESELNREKTGISGSLWLNSLSEVIHEKLKNTSTEANMFEDFGFSDEIDPGIEGRVAYLKNKFTTLAFDRFDTFIPDSKSLYSNSFEASCEAVYNRVSEYCILPVSNSNDGELTAFTGMIAKFDLHIVATTDIDDVDGRATTLALLARNIRTPSRKDFGKYRFEFSVGSPTNDSLCGILASASKHGLSLFGTSSRIYGEESQTLTLAFTTENASVASFKTFVFTLLAVFPHFIPRGLYIHI